MRRGSILLLALVWCVLLGCGRKTKTVVGPDGSKATITQKGDNAEITVTGAKGEVVQVASGKSGVALPKNFPSDVPVYPAAKVTTSATSKETTTVVLTTADPAEKVLDFYSDKLKANGWEIETTMNTQDGAMVTATKNKRTCSAYIARSNDQTTVSLGITAARE